MKIIYTNAIGEETKHISCLYRDVARLLSEEALDSKGTVVRVVEEEHPEHYLVYNVGQRSGTRFITELENTMPDSYLDKEVSDRFLTCVDPEKNAYKFYKLSFMGDMFRASYGRMGQMKGQLFGERSFDYPLSMFWIKYFEKLSKGYVDRTDVYLNSKEKEHPGPVKDQIAKEDQNRASVSLFKKLKDLAKKAVEQAQVKVPITQAILDYSHLALEKMKTVETVEEFNTILLDLISVLQRPVKTGDGTGVKQLMAKDKADFLRIITREDDLLQAMEGTFYGSPKKQITDGFAQYGIEVYEATEDQKKQVIGLLSDSLKGKVKNIYRVIPIEQQKSFNEYLRTHKIKKVKQLWHGSRNQNWLSIAINSLKLRPDAIITGKMFGDGIYFAKSSMKSWNYTSYRGTSWAGGNSDVAYMGLYATAYGTPYDVHTWSASRDYKKEMEDQRANCVHAHAGSMLRNDEIIFYSEAAMVLNYIVEFV